ncbi:MAG: hypothetical protein ACR9NN_18085 [Nostochopsis sp.]
MRKFSNHINTHHYLSKPLAFSLLSLWFWWVLANLFNVVIGQLSFFAGPMFGISQWLVLRKYIRHLGWWILVSANSWIATYLIIYVFKAGEKIVEIAPQGNLLVLGVTVEMQGLWTYILITVLQSTVIGVFQWLVLRTRIQYASWWIFAGLIGGVTKGMAIALVQPIVNPIFVEFIGSLLYGSVTGIALVGLLQIRIQNHLERQMYWR